ncbi:hypothetical protein CBW24_17040 (plasmid) [Pacificitalea manganoxidans]|uniref:DUF475 domain-containing protein n=1 Tax=Pacificitalea manganoxidans TaxID=1411902 RepID=A0A291M4F0_9RHOB|nr:DUF475 domain-containing protein [Pacificitalea manganoxidans]ATI43846.1 hypothetical protein CBW24_17040 [Pacificitalea manganoxidans]MBF51576.1 DUF475 domain-containing protein [Actibacterium sp.]MDR6310256.1 hypothetical protein [Pacificitalea manganoxidans]
MTSPSPDTRPADGRGTSPATLRYFRWAFIVTFVGLALSAVLGWQSTGTVSGAATMFFICAVLAVLEISLSFDNAIVNANKLKDMQPVWQRRFLTWGIIIAVFGMRIVFPLAVVAIAARIGPIEAIRLAATEPAEYARLMTEAHLAITAFGGAFLMMVGLSFFLDEHKDVDWLRRIERRLRSMGTIKGVTYGIVLLVVLLIGAQLPVADRATFYQSAILGLVVFMAVETLSHVLDAGSTVKGAAASGGLGAFLYLEVLDASFSFDGVIGAFALTQNLFLIAIGLGIGAMYVRSMTIMLVEKQTLSHLPYLEHGAFYSIIALAVIMFAQSLVHVPEVITGLLGAAIIGLSLWSSLRYNRRAAAAV